MKLTEKQVELLSSALISAMSYQKMNIQKSTDNKEVIRRSDETIEEYRELIKVINKSLWVKV